jgi:putative flippase GtrA
VRRRFQDGLSERALRYQLVRFVVVGAANTLLSIVVYRVLLGIGVWYVVAAPVAYVASLLNGYLLNRAWTFGARDSTRARVTYLGVQASGAILTSVLVLLLVDAAGLGELVAFIAAAVPVTLCTFAANRAWTFADPSSRS